MVAAHKDRTRARILAAAADLVSARGAEELAMTTLARRAGVARATLYNYFPSAERVLEALVETQVTAFLSELDERLDATRDPGERLGQAVGALVAWVANQPARGSAHARRSAHGRRPQGSSARAPDVASIHRPLATLENRVEEIIAAARAAGHLPPHTESALAARFTITLVLGVRRQLGGADRDHVARSLRDFLLAGLGAASPRP